jgi:hypothetical protein
VQVDLAVFAVSVPFPADPLVAYAPVDLRPAVSSAVSGVAIPLANINTAGAVGGADVGAYEAGAPIPTYGPR